MCVWVHAPQSQRIMDSLDVRAHGFIGLAEFAAGTIKETVYLDSKRVYAAFLVMSTHGHISVDSLTVMLADHLNIDDPEFCRSTAIEMITQVDEEEDVRVVWCGVCACVCLCVCVSVRLLCVCMRMCVRCSPRVV